MTNGEIILGQTVLLIANNQISEEEEIHTYAHWKSLGYQVKKGQKAVAQFPIWKYTSKKKAEEVSEEVSEEEAQAHGYCFMKMSSFFSTKQVEPIT